MNFVLAKSHLTNGEKREIRIYRRDIATHPRVIKLLNAPFDAISKYGMNVTRALKNAHVYIHERDSSSEKETFPSFIVIQQLISCTATY